MNTSSFRILVFLYFFVSSFSPPLSIKEGIDFTCDTIAQFDTNQLSFQCQSNVILYKPCSVFSIEMSLLNRPREPLTYKKLQQLHRHNISSRQRFFLICAKNKLSLGSSELKLPFRRDSKVLNFHIDFSSAGLFCKYLHPARKVQQLP